MRIATKMSDSETAPVDRLKDTVDEKATKSESPATENESSAPASSAAEPTEDVPMETVSPADVDVAAEPAASDKKPPVTEVPLDTDAVDTVKDKPTEPIETSDKKPDDTVKNDTAMELDSQAGTSDTNADNSVNDEVFEPSLEMMINDFDDERTLEEEEALAAAESNDATSELDSLQRVCMN